MIKAGFDRAMAVLAPPAVKHISPQAGAAKTEEEWLRVAANPDLIRTAAVGETILLTGGGPERTLRIVDVQDAGDAATHIDTSTGRARVLLVTCREGDEATGIEFRLRLEGRYVRDVAIAQRPHAL